MAVWAAILGRHIGLHITEHEKLATGCAMCDVGMTQLPTELLGQAENLTEEQRRIIMAHPKIGADLVAKSKDVDFEIIAMAPPSSGGVAVATMLNENCNSDLRFVSRCETGDPCVVTVLVWDFILWDMAEFSKPNYLGSAGFSSDFNIFQLGF